MYYLYTSFAGFKALLKKTGYKPDVGQIQSHTNFCLFTLICLISFRDSKRLSRPRGTQTLILCKISAIYSNMYICHLVALLINDFTPYEKAKMFFQIVKRLIYNVAIVIHLDSTIS